ncbi:MAG: leucine-rich repeat protein [Clostridiales bacterium]|nr:leucine-rich repeat protein [Clostridiales bacterium]
MGENVRGLCVYDFGCAGAHGRNYRVTGTADVLEIPGEIDGYKVTKIGDWVFHNCASLVEVVLPDGVTEIGDFAFLGCASLAKVVLPDGVTRIGQGVLDETAYFNEASNWQDGFLYNGSHLIKAEDSIGACTIRPGTKSIAGGAFEGCTSLTEVVIPDSVTRIGPYTFKDCSSLTDVVLPDSVTEIGECAFEACMSLTEVVLPDGVTEIGGGAFNNCVSLVKVVIPDGVTRIRDSVFFACISLTEVELPDGVTEIGESAFNFCPLLTEVVLPDSVTEIGAYAFDDCTSLAEVVIPDSVTEIGACAFSGCGDILVGTGNASYSSEDGVLFNKDKSELLHCPGKKEGRYSIPGSVTSMGQGAFEGCASLTEVVIPDGLTSIGRCAFYECSSLVEVVLPDGLTCIGDGAFYGCTSLVEIVLPDSVTEIGSEAFYGCTSLSEVVIPDSVTRIGPYAFAWCVSLAKVTIPDGVTEIGRNTFENCTSLVEIVLPDSVTSIGYYAFLRCTSLTHITIPKAVESIDEEALGYSWVDSPDEPVKLKGFTIIGYPGTAAEDYARKHGFAFIALTQLTDPGTGVMVYESQEGAIPAGARLTVSPVSQPAGRTAYDISLRSAGGEAVQPAGEVQVSLPVPAGMEGSGCKVYRIEADGGETDMQAVYRDGKLTFSTDHFSLYVIAEEAQSALPGDMNNDGLVTIQDVMEACKVLARQSAGTAPTADEMTRGDLDGDDKFTISDVMEICKVLARQA